MSEEIKQGSVVIVAFKYQESNQVKKRPALVLEVFPKSYYLCQITSTDGRGKRPGKWIEKDSDVGQEMGLLNSSYINYVQAKEVMKTMVFIPPSPVGYCFLINQILQEIDDL